MADDSFDVPRKFFDKLTGVGEQLLGDALLRVLQKVGAEREGAPLSGWRLLKSAQDFLWEDRPETEQIRDLKESLQYVLEHVQHSQRHGKARSCYCKELVSGEHMADPICAVCSLRAAEIRAQKALGLAPLRTPH